MAQHKPKHGKTFADQVVKCARVFVQQLGFHMGPPASLSYSNVTWCPGSHEPPEDTLREFSVEHDALFILAPVASGAQALAQALARHEAYVLPKRGCATATSVCLLCQLQSAMSGLRLSCSVLRHAVPQCTTCGAAAA